MQAADTPQVEQAIQRARRFESSTRLWISTRNATRSNNPPPPPPLTVNDAGCIVECLREITRLDTLHIYCCPHLDAAVLDVFRNRLPLCTSVTTVILDRVNLSNDDLDRLRSAFYNTSVTKIQLRNNDIQGQRGGEVLRDLLVGNDTLRELYLSRNNNHFGPEVAIGFGQGLTDNHALQVLSLYDCHISNDFLTNLLLPADGGIINNSLLNLDLSNNDIQGAEGGRQVSLLLSCFPTLKVLHLHNNYLGPLGAHALAPGLATAIQLQELSLRSCGLGINGMTNLVPDGQVNTSLTSLVLNGNGIQGLEGGKNVVALVARCTNLDRLDVVNEKVLSPDQQRHVDMLLDQNRQNRLCTEAQALAGSAFSVLFRFMEKAHRHEHGLAAIFVILQNDGDDYYGTALNRTID